MLVPSLLGRTVAPDLGQQKPPRLELTHDALPSPTEVKLPPLTLGLSVFLVAALSVRLLDYAGFEHAPFVVLVAGLIAGGVVAIFR